ncbi:MAG TPA: hypothetical protein VF533_15340 [Solirubrobacteraceae bacterium]
MTRRPPVPEPPSLLLTSGLAELAAGALSGWVYTLVRTQPDQARRLGIVSGPRIRQWHLDLAMLGTATVACAHAVPDAPRPVAAALGVGAWTNAMAFLPLAFKPDLDQRLAFKAAAAASFTATSVGFTGMAATAITRRRRRGR